MKNIKLVIALALGVSIVVNAFGINGINETPSGKMENDIAINTKKLDLYKNWCSSPDTALMIKKIECWHSDSIRKFFDEYYKVEISSQELTEMNSNLNQFKKEVNQQTSKKFVIRY